MDFHKWAHTFHGFFFSIGISHRPPCRIFPLRRFAQGGGIRELCIFFFINFVAKEIRRIVSSPAACHPLHVDVPPGCRASVEALGYHGADAGLAHEEAPVAGGGTKSLVRLVEGTANEDF